MEPNPLTADEVREILAVAKTYQDTAVSRTLVSSGIRKSELAKLNVKDVYLERRRLMIGEGKGNKERTAIKSSECVDAVSVQAFQNIGARSDRVR